MSEPEPTRVQIDRIEVSFDDLAWFFAKAIVAFVAAAACLAVPVALVLAAWVYGVNGGDWPFV